MTAIASSARVARLTTHHVHAHESAAPDPAKSAHAHAGVAELERHRRDPARAATPRGKAKDEQIGPHRKVDTPDTPEVKHMRKVLARTDRQYGQLVHQLDTIRAAVDSGDMSTAYAAFGRARQLMRSIVAAGNEVRIDMRTGDKQADAIRAKVGQDVVNAYEIANAIEGAMPGDQYV